jgi:hypothetical protein
MNSTWYDSKNGGLPWDWSSWYNGIVRSSFCDSEESVYSSLCVTLIKLLIPPLNPSNQTLLNKGGIKQTPKTHEHPAKSKSSPSQHKALPKPKAHPKKPRQQSQAQNPTENHQPHAQNTNPKQTKQTRQRNQPAQTNTNVSSRSQPRILLKHL